MSKIALFHKADLDGHASGAIIKKAIPDIKLIPYDYNEPLPNEVWMENELVVFVDVTPSLKEMIDISKKTKKFIWIDHHIQIMKQAEAYGFNPEGIRDNDFSACENAWRYFFPEKEIPKAVYFLGRYDVWKHQGIHNCLSFQYGMRSRTTDPTDLKSFYIWETLLSSPSDDIDSFVKNQVENFILDIVDDGEICQEYEDSVNAEYVKNFSYEAEFEGMKAIVLNKGRSGSLTFKSIWDNSKYDCMICFVQKKGENGEYQYSVSMYTDKPGLDLSEIAVKYGGGGHKQACGFPCKTLPF